MNDFHCSSCDTRTERLVEHDVKQIECECGGIANHMIGMPTVRLEGITGDFPGAHIKWAKIREDNAKIKAKRNS